MLEKGMKMRREDKKNRSNMDRNRGMEDGRKRRAGEKEGEREEGGSRGVEREREERERNLGT